MKYPFKNLLDIRVKRSKVVLQAILYRLSDLLTLILFISVEKTPTSFRRLDLKVVEKTNKTKSRKL